MITRSTLSRLVCVAARCEMARKNLSSFVQKQTSDGNIAYRCHPDAEPDASMLVLLHDAVSNIEHDRLVEDVAPRLAKRRYEGNHWDDVIVHYKEIELTDWKNLPSGPILNRLQRTICTQLGINATTEFLPPHVIDLAADGYIQPHVDSIKFSGKYVIGLSLLSTRILRLIAEHDAARSRAIEVLLPPRTLYMLRENLRYQYGHAILGPHDVPLYWDRVDCRQRVSVMFRDALEADVRQPTTQRSYIG